MLEAQNKITFFITLQNLFTTLDIFANRHFRSCLHFDDWDKMDIECCPYRLSLTILSTNSYFNFSLLFYSHIWILLESFYLFQFIWITSHRQYLNKFLLHWYWQVSYNTPISYLLYSCSLGLVGFFFCNKWIVLHNRTSRETIYTLIFWIQNIF